ncbi:DUF294 nucleotidyltransferase-like domain-containing protein [Motilimonas sp. 1_MG-2023]|uniref:DUF294 nucleotidyltransferase-like domain-containing protein n=1 Tax=Motilimonas sp. 1_MG-2023 TaxID=3062672 RepID=UPI0026E3B722|nr:DUF294 nucleotidyltransferase-like domain-containing protein [Motilimonas sp. 1_MG-2023]MDO6526672.1 DUF294 nucleotidyltransferase-like domain-containing protein [Motilimonas sp. 1_MG-2023]
MAEHFSFTHAPFDLLTKSQQKLFLDHLDIVYFPEQAHFIKQGETASLLYIVLKGLVEEFSEANQSIFAHYTNNDFFDIRSQFGSPCKHDYRTIEETICHTLPSDVFRDLLNSNAAFADYFQRDLAQKYAQLEAREGNKNLAEFILTRIDDSNVQPAIVIGSDVSLKTATKMMLEQKLETLIVEQDGLYGMLTGTDLLRAAVLDEQTLDSAVAHYANYRLISIEQGDFLFNAMLAMTQHQIERVVVKNGDSIVGIMEMAHVLSLFSTHSHVIALRIARAKNIEELKKAAQTLNNLVENLTNNGIKIVFIMELLATMNGQIMKKLFELLVPESVQNQVCLIVMGSEGRGEQILKTDQDNGLILGEHLIWPEQQATLAAFSQHLLSFGYPPCPGQVMVNNPFWVKTSNQWHEQIEQWLLHGQSGDSESLMQLAIINDAHAVAGDKTLLPPLKQQIIDGCKGKEVMLSQFARIALQFGSPLNFFGHIKSNDAGLDIKKGGIFTIVHGIRSLAIEQGIATTNTLARIRELAKLRVLEQKQSQDLQETLQLFFWLRLEQHLTPHQQGMNLLDITQLTPNERDLLRHGLHVVKKFKSFLAHHFMIRDY